MGCGGGKPQNKNPQAHQQPPNNIFEEPTISNENNTPNLKLEYILSQKPLEYLEKKRPNYDNLINKLVTEMNIQKMEFLSYNQLLVENYRKINKEHNLGKELIESSINFMNQELEQFIKLEQSMDEQDQLLQQKSFKFLIELYLILQTMKTEIQSECYWLGHYMNKYYDQDHQITEQNDNPNAQISNLKSIELQLKQGIQKAIQKIQHRQRQQQLMKINNSQDEVMSKINQNQSGTLVHYARSQNQKYKTPI
ncbi:unnamed protein product [Paramecium pentaurelia]|uniref:Uncharacterized protein n=1 Tax=Paramecium pentaurelia TaxID=43138 RepID=A0A8S1T4D4_9CILI|nr:unnamed protein product [Paramecium pentaurelia]